MTDPSSYASHLETLLTQWQAALKAENFAAAAVTAGAQLYDFADDHGPVFKPNAMLGQWLPPVQTTPGSRLLVTQDKQAILFLHQPADYWHADPVFPDRVAAHLEVRAFAEHSALTDNFTHCLHQQNGAVAWLGPAETSVVESDNEHVNPPHLLHRLYLERTRKSQWEIDCMAAASRMGAKGHLAARDAFHAGGSEFEIHQAYLLASGQNEKYLPYGNIVALNEHGSVLHYQHQQRSTSRNLSLLIDAGGQHHGYASDITRTWVAHGDAHNTFRNLVEAMQTLQDGVIDYISPGLDYANLHLHMHKLLAGVLVDAGIVTCSAAEALEQGLTRLFCPHGLGHLLGLQVHDVGGYLADEPGHTVNPPEGHDTLRCTRTIERGQVFTIEPGLYFMPYFLDPLRADDPTRGNLVNWPLIDHLLPYGGIRIEDNIHVLADATQNLTREAFAHVQA